MRELQHDIQKAKTNELDGINVEVPEIDKRSRNIRKHQKETSVNNSEFRNFMI